MSWRKIGLLVLFADFLAFTAWVVYAHGYVAFYELLLGTGLGVQVFADLVIALSLVAVWMVGDARKHGISPVPYLLLTLFLGSLGPLLYLIRRPEEEPSRVARVAAHA